ncbi:MAG: hypothetical protein EA375_06385 [Acholeplasmataceae bacterium]|nr:MAG: hypothetical protein EA375_06385 [Acholeplasmataceae bacterium]
MINTKEASMNASQLKWIGVITMTIDHIAVYLIHSTTLLHWLLRGIGRIAFPLFAFMIAEGFHHTRNRFAYWLRLMLYTLLIEVFLVGYYLYTHINYSVLPFTGTGSSVNFILPLFFGLSALVLLHEKRVWLRPFALLIVVLAGWLGTPYGMYGVLLIIAFGILRRVQWQLLAGVTLTLLYVYGPLVMPAIPYYGFMQLQLLAIIALLMLFAYNGRRGKSNRWFFYVYYPLHIGILMLIAYWL